VRWADCRRVRRCGECNFYRTGRHLGELRADGLHKTLLGETRLDTCCKLRVFWYRGVQTLLSSRLSVQPYQAYAFRFGGESSCPRLARASTSFIQNETRRGWPGQTRPLRTRLLANSFCSGAHDRGDHHVSLWPARASAAIASAEYSRLCFRSVSATAQLRGISQDQIRLPERRGYRHKARCRRS